MMEIYKASYRYQWRAFLGIVSGLPTVLCGGIAIFVGLYFVALVTLIPGIVVLYWTLFAYPKKISIAEDGILYKAMFRTIHINFSEIKDVQTHYNTTRLYLSDGNKEKADMLCVILLNDRPLTVLPFGNSIIDYKHLYKKILHHINNSK